MWLYNGWSEADSTTDKAPSSSFREATQAPEKTYSIAEAPKETPESAPPLSAWRRCQHTYTTGIGQHFP